MEAILTDCYPAVHRIAHAVVGENAIAQRVVTEALRQGVRVIPTWRKGFIAENWFYHHTLLIAREAAPAPPAAERDLLAAAGPKDEASYVAFIRALRELPRQQMEAFILNHGEQFNPRLLGVAMDCSTGAATTHLTAATDALKTIGGEQFATLTAALGHAYKALTPPPTVVHGAVHRQVGAALWALRLRRLVRRLVLLAVLAIIAYAAWRWRDTLRHWYEVVRSHAQMQRT